MLLDPAPTLTTRPLLLAPATRAQAITASKQGDDSRALTAVLHLASILEGMPALGPASPETELIAGGGKSWGGAGGQLGGQEAGVARPKVWRSASHGTHAHPPRLPGVSHPLRQLVLRLGG